VVVTDFFDLAIGKLDDLGPKSLDHPTIAETGAVKE
jgi:hypothetical protein